MFLLLWSALLWLEGELRAIILKISAVSTSRHGGRACVQREMAAVVQIKTKSNHELWWSRGFNARDEPKSHKYRAQIPHVNSLIAVPAPFLYPPSILNDFQTFFFRAGTRRFEKNIRAINYVAVTKTCVFVPIYGW